MYIGDIYLPILSNIDKKSVSKITKEIAGINAKEPRTVSIRRNLQPITLEGYLYNDGEKDDAQYAEDVEALQYRSAGYCYTKYADLDGFIEIENAEAPQTSEELGVRNYSVEGKYLPASKYERVVEVETEMRENEFNIEFPPHVALPVGATNVRVKTSQDSVKLTAPAFMAGDIPIYRPFPAFYPDDVTHSAGDTPKYDTTAYKMSYNLLDAEDESISYTFVSGVDVPLGSYRVVLRMKEDTTIASDARIVVLSGDNVVVDSLHTLVGDNVWNIVKSASFNITQRGITYTIMVSKAEADIANLVVNYGFLLPEKRARVAFDVAAEYDVGECKVFDTITTDSEESTWIQVFNPEHDFAGDIVVQNSTMRWIIKQTAWKDATKVYNISGSAPVEIGKLYNKAFGDDSVTIKFKEIKPNYLKFTFELDTGNATSESISAKEIDTVEITPFNVVIDKDVIGAYKDHYTFESTPDVMIEYENGVIAGIDSNSVYGLIKSVNVTSSYDGDIIETTGSESSDSYVVPFVIPCEITNYLYKQAADLVISKDNNDIERKFWKDDFSVDSSDNYTGDVASFTWDTANQLLSVGGLTNYSVIYNTEHRGAVGNEFVFNVSFPSVSALTKQSNRGIYALFYLDSNNWIAAGICGDTDGAIRYALLYMSGGSLNAKSSGSVGTVTDGDTITVKVSVESDQITVCNSVNGFNTSRSVLYSEGNITDISQYMVGVMCHLHPCNINNITYTPSISYSDDFSTDTTERYQPVLGTVAYDDANKRMNVTTATGVNGKASGRLKSYKFCEGAQQFDVTLPVGADGDFICMVTHATNPAMTNGIGVGLQSDGAGNWNLATLSGTTVTVGASSGLTDGKTARIEIEKDITGAYWYYIYDAAGTKPTTATGKLFTTLTEGYTGWYANGNSKTYAIDNISIRAESIVGRTNIEEEEAFWFRDEFGENDSGRWRNSSDWVWDTVNGQIQNTKNDTFTSFGVNPLSLTELKFDISSQSLVSGNVGIKFNAGYTNNSYTFGTGYILQFNPTLNYCRFRRLNADGTRDNLQDITMDTAWDTTAIYNIKITSDGEGTYSIYVGKNGGEYELKGTVVDTTWIMGYHGFASNTTEKFNFTNFEFSGTRVYQKPIHRGAMLETYHDGTQEVVGTTFIDDCQWDRSAEWVKFGAPSTATHDTVNGNIRLAVTGGSGRHVFYRSTIPLRGGLYTVFTSSDSHDRSGLFIGSDGTSGGDGTYDITNGIKLGSVAIRCGVFLDGVNVLEIATTVDHRGKLMQVLWLPESNYLAIYLDGVLDRSYTNPVLGDSRLGGFCGVWHAHGSTSSPSKFSNIQFIAASPDATNGIAACIPPVGGGARYGVEESVYNTFTTENVNKGVYLTTAKVKTTNPNADEVSLEYINDTTSITLNTTPIDVDATYTVKTAPITIDANETDTLRVSVKNSTTCVQSTNYVDSLSLIPVSGDDVLYPQDLAFISGVKPSQKRKVEVK